MAYVIINVKAGTGEEVLEDLVKLEGVTEACLVYGIYDILCKIEVDNMGRLKEAVARIRELDNVRLTQTLLVYKTFPSNTPYFIDR